MRFFSKISTKINAFILLFSFLGIYLINISCTIGNLTHDLEWFSQSTKSHEHGGHHDNNHHHSHNNNNDKKQESKDDGCCSDVATVFFASVQFPVQQLSVKFLSTQLVLLNVVINDILSPNFSFDLFIDNHPPPNLLLRIPNIRIFIQSFQI